MAIARRTAPAKPSRKPRREAKGSVIELSPEEAWQLFDEQARKLLGMSAEEFEAAWDAGEFDDRIEDRNVLQIYFTRAPKPS